MTVKQHLMYALRASGPLTHEELQGEILAQCEGANLDNVEHLVSEGMMELISAGHAKRYDDVVPFSWDVNYNYFKELGETALADACGDKHA